MVVWFLIGGRCPEEGESEFKRNPALELFLPDSLSFSYTHYFSPVWAPSGDKIYCIARDWDSIQKRFYHMLLSVRISDKKIDTLVKDSVMLFALSNKGEKIAYVKGYKENNRFEIPSFPLSEENVIFIDLATGNFDAFDPVAPYIADLEYTSDDSFLIYFGYGDTSIQGFYSLNIATLQESLILKVPGEIHNKTFTLHPLNDSIIRGDSLWYPEFYPKDISKIAYAKNAYFGSDNKDEEIFLFNLITNKKIALNAKPYFYTDIGKISFSPDGSKIIFSALKCGVGGEIVRCSRQELWILNLH
jgi:hypothetical protein